MLKKIVAILLIVLLAGATTACVSDQDDDLDIDQFNWALDGYKIKSSLPGGLDRERLHDCKYSTPFGGKIHGY